MKERNEQNILIREIVIIINNKFSKNIFENTGKRFCIYLFSFVLKLKPVLLVLDIVPGFRASSRFPN